MDLVDLANLRLQVSDHPAAERLVRQALAADPHNLPALNTLAVIFHFTKRDRQAMQILRRTINARPEDPNAYYNLAGILCGKEEPEQSLKTLERLFANASCSSEVARTIFSHAFMLCDELQHILAQKNSERASDAVEELRREVVHITGCPVDIGYGEVPQGLAAVAQMASESGSGHHVICYDPTLPDLVLPHVIAHELTHLELEARAQAAGKARTLAPCPATSEFLRNFCSPRDHLTRLRELGWKEESIGRAVSQWAERVLFNLMNTPADLVVETRLHERLPILSASQFLAMGELARRLADLRNDLSPDSVVPRQTMRIILALWSVRLRLHDSIFHHTTAFGLDYMGTEAYPLATQLWECWQAAAPSLGPGDEYRLIDEFAEIVGLRQGYEWATGPTVTPEAPKA